MSRARFSSRSYVAERPPTMSRMPANTSLNTFAPRMASPVTMPRYFVIRFPSIPGVVVVSMLSHSSSPRDVPGDLVCGDSKHAPRREDERQGDERHVHEDLNPPAESESGRPP